jgi:hypothetical protein
LAAAKSGALLLATVIEPLGDRPSVQVFKCENAFAS